MSGGGEVRSGCGGGCGCGGGGEKTAAAAGGGAGARFWLRGAGAAAAGFGSSRGRFAAAGGGAGTGLGQRVLSTLIKRWGRPSMIVLVIALVLGASTLVMSVSGVLSFRQELREGKSQGFNIQVKGES